MDCDVSGSLQWISESDEGPIITLAWGGWKEEERGGTRGNEEERRGTRRNEEEGGRRRHQHHVWAVVMREMCMSWGSKVV